MIDVRKRLYFLGPAIVAALHRVGCLRLIGRPA